ncbi:MAG TPA: hypothetical protein VHW02_03415 [Rhizomicrobium sp.]|nr:hypothetical protein [Rhizomicrobium sp.]
MAQTDDEPPVADAPASAPPRQLPQNTGDYIAPQPVVMGRPMEAGVQVSSLGEVDGPAVGLLDDTNGGLGREMWTGSDRGAIEDMLARIPAATPSSGVRALARRLLLTTADAPSGNIHRSILTIRLETLLNAGMVGEAGALAAQAQIKNDPDFARLQADALLYAGRADDACGALTQTRLTSAEPYWIELRAYCYAQSGDGAALDLTRSVMDSQGLDDKAFETLLSDVIAEKANDPGEIKDPTALDVFLMQKAGVPVNEAVASQLGVAARLAELHDAKNSIADRVAAASKLVRTGAVSSSDLMLLADAQKFSTDDLANAAVKSQGMYFVAGEALLAQAIKHEKDNGKRAQLVAAAFVLGEKKQVLALAAQMQGDAAATLIPDATMHDAAPLMARALMLAGKPQAAAAWIALLDPGKDRMAASVLTATLDMIATDPARDAQAQAALHWLSRQTGDPRAALVLGVTDALGAPMPPEAHDAAANAGNLAGRRPAPVQMQRLNAALGDPQRRGEAVLIVLNVIGPSGPGDLAPDVTAALLRALVKLGLSDAARTIGIEALLTQAQ